MSKIVCKAGSNRPHSRFDKHQNSHIAVNYLSVCGIIPHKSIGAGELNAYFGAGTTEFLAKLAVAIVLLHIGAALLSPPLYSYLIQQEWMVLSDFINAIAVALRDFFGSFLGLI